MSLTHTRGEKLLSNEKRKSKREYCSDAYAVACLGVTALDWERLGVAALEELSFEVARKAFQRSENFLFLTLIDQLQVRISIILSSEWKREHIKI